jgi:hypothetical protein
MFNKNKSIVYLFIDGVERKFEVEIEYKFKEIEEDTYE